SFLSWCWRSCAVLSTGLRCQSRAHLVWDRCRERLAHGLDTFCCCLGCRGAAGASESAVRERARSGSMCRNQFSRSSPLLLGSSLASGQVADELQLLLQAG